ncbi:hypothetical protein P12x_005592 [Tundrisphaera lichenicola]|uniref:hypothetical protein n=1 Tax=Tundrisphaera lichenicola TaxID=2029860 RepID=UPI003EBD85D9
MQFGTMPALALVATLALSGAGCGAKSEFPDTLPVSGKVTYKGQPVTKGTVTFQPDQGQPATGAIQADGTYQLSTFAEKDGALPGHHKVMIIATDGDPNMMPGSSPGYKPPKDLVPKKYNSLTTSGLEAEVTADKPVQDFDLK